MIWAPGDKAICIDATWQWGPSPLVLGQLYEVRAVHVIEGESLLPDGTFSREPFIVLDVGVDKPYDPIYHGDDEGFGAERFRKVQVRKTDISALTALLNPTQEVERT